MLKKFAKRHENTKEKVVEDKLIKQDSERDDPAAIAAVIVFQIAVAAIVMIIHIVYR